MIAGSFEPGKLRSYSAAQHANAPYRTLNSNTRSSMVFVDLAFDTDFRRRFLASQAKLSCVEAVFTSGFTITSKVLHRFPAPYSESNRLRPPWHRCIAPPGA